MWSSQLPEEANVDNVKVNFFPEYTFFLSMFAKWKSITGKYLDYIRLYNAIPISNIMLDEILKFSK